MKFTKVLQRIDEKRRSSAQRVDEKLLRSSNASRTPVELRLSQEPLQLDVVDGPDSVQDGDFVDDMVDELHEVFDENLASRNVS